MNDFCPKCGVLLEEYVGLIHCPTCHGFTIPLREPKDKSEEMARDLEYGLQKLKKIHRKLVFSGDSEL